jgi:hypothetical protein
VGRGCVRDDDAGHKERQLVHAMKIEGQRKIAKGYRVMCVLLCPSCGGDKWKEKRIKRNKGEN